MTRMCWENRLVAQGNHEPRQQMPPTLRDRRHHFAASVRPHPPRPLGLAITMSRYARKMTHAYARPDVETADGLDDSDKDGAYEGPAPESAQRHRHQCHQANMVPTSGRCSSSWLAAPPSSGAGEPEQEGGVPARG